MNWKLLVSILSVATLSTALASKPISISLDSNLNYHSPSSSRRHRNLGIDIPLVSRERFPTSLPSCTSPMGSRRVIHILTASYCGQGSLPRQPRTGAMSQFREQLTCTTTKQNSTPKQTPGKYAWTRASGSQRAAARQRCQWCKERPIRRVILTLPLRSDDTLCAAKLHPLTRNQPGRS